MPRSMLSAWESVRWALSGIQRQGCGWAPGPAWVRTGTRREQAAGATTSLLQPSEVAAEKSGEVSSRLTAGQESLADWMVGKRHWALLDSSRQGSWPGDGTQMDAGV